MNVLLTKAGRCWLDLPWHPFLFCVSLAKAITIVSSFGALLCDKIQVLMILLEGARTEPLEYCFRNITESCGLWNRALRAERRQ